jgi:uncharacterized protein YecE (DUF72 family)
MLQPDPNYTITPNGHIQCGESTQWDRKQDLAEWIEVLKTVHKRKIQILAFANNHYAGFGPGTIEQFRRLWQRQVPTETGERNRPTEQGQLFR